MEETIGTANDESGHDWDGLCTAKVARLIFANGKGGLYLTRLVKIDERFMENSFSDIKILTYTLKEIQRLIDIFFADEKCPPMFFRNDELILPENPNPVGSVVDGNVVADVRENITDAISLVIPQNGDAEAFSIGVTPVGTGGSPDAPGDGCKANVSFIGKQFQWSENNVLGI
ncbi:uncharacterized protein RSE6_06894 [Rhynchosporium secalis]|uniref:Uncharacterized protein n=1 Tax=Rhynchosporium secalis TaxID=38038 RepID=A0A1E1MBK0_RHYSE|nr:uncharacterized protein RSE6_06894 [Rhynchosporium secalis]